MHYASLKKSKRLQRLYNLLSDGLHHSTREITKRTHICAVNSAVSELRRNGIDIECRFFSTTIKGERIYHYWMIEKIPKVNDTYLKNGYFLSVAYVEKGFVFFTKYTVGWSDMHRMPIYDFVAKLAKEKPEKIA